MKISGFKDVRVSSGHEPVVILSQADFESLRGTAYLKRSPTNARRLIDVKERLEASEGTERGLTDTD